jgi:hypothetical protein
MSGGVKSGLIFGLVGLIVVGGLTVIPTLGALCCGPLGALLLGGGAGFMGVRWGGPAAGIGQGVLGGSLSGLGVLIGTIIGISIYFAIVLAIPEMQALLDEQLQQPGMEGLTEADRQNLLGVLGPIAGLCFGVLNLILAVGAGALGGWLGVRQRKGQEPQPPMAPPAMPA